MCLEINQVLFFFNDTATAEICTLSLHDALPISMASSSRPSHHAASPRLARSEASNCIVWSASVRSSYASRHRSEEHTSELQSRQYLVCRLLLEKKNQISLRPRQSPSFLFPYCLW